MIKPPVETLELELDAGLVITCQSPSLSELAYSANRLLRLKLPLPDPLAVHLRLLHRQLRCSQPPKKRRIDQLAPPLLEETVRKLWCHALGQNPVLPAPAEDLLLSALLVVRMCSVFSPQALGEQILHQLAISQGHGLPMGREARPQALETGEQGNNNILFKLIEALRRFACPNPWLNALEITAPKTDYWRAFHLDRALQNPLPWTALLLTLTDAERENFSELNILGSLIQYGEAHWSEVLKPLEQLLQQKNLHAFWNAALRFWNAIGTVNPKAYLPQTLVLVEGSTEEILLPAISRSCMQGWEQRGIWLHGVGGKNAMVGWLGLLIQTVSLPLRVVLDRDAESLLPDLLPRLRSEDSLFLLPEGELEDILPLSWILTAINRQQQLFPPLTTEVPDLQSLTVSRCDQLKALYRSQAWGGFDKVQLANQIAEQLSSGRVALSTLPFTLQQLLTMIARKDRVPGFHRIGLTGGIASGKSTVGKLLEEHGIPVLDTDRVVHTLLNEDRELRQQIASVFGSTLFDKDCQLNRKSLGEQVFGNLDRKRLLEGWIHPKVRAEVLRFFEQAERTWQQDAAKLPLAVAMIPLLFESALTWMVDESWLLLTSEAQQRERLIHSRGMSETEAMARIRSQWPQDRKQALAHHCINNEGKLAELPPQLDCLLKKFMA